MGHFTVIEYSGKDSAKVLSRITGADKSQGIEIVDATEHHPIGFRMDPEQENEDDEPTDSSG